MATKNILDIETVRKLLAYDPESGQLTWRHRPVDMFPNARIAKIWNTRFSGKTTFTAIDHGGYRYGTILYGKMRAHRVAWVIVHGEWPAADIDHINGVRTDNRIVNLRSVTRQENLQNTARRSDNTSGAVGVSWRNDTGKWYARIWANGEKINLGCFATIEAACAARKDAESRYGYHANHGR